MAGQETRHTTEAYPEDLEISTIGNEAAIMDESTRRNV
jgi:hypothetical protein